MHGGKVLDETKQKIMNAAMSLIKDKGYVATTTKDIANLAQVNECTIFRKFKTKKDIVLCAMREKENYPNVTPDIFSNVTWELKTDLQMFMERYLERVTSDFVRLSIGLRAPQIYEETASMIIKIPEVFINSLTEYLKKMCEKGKIKKTDFKCLALTIFSATFGFTFLKASFQDKLSKIKQQEYIKKSVELFVNGIQIRD